MKKAKMMLTAIAVLTVVGTAFAFKAQKFNSTIYKDDGTGNCTIPIHFRIDPTLGTVNMFVTAVSGDNVHCKAQKVIADQ